MPAANAPASSSAPAPTGTATSSAPTPFPSACSLLSPTVAQRLNPAVESAPRAPVLAATCIYTGTEGRGAVAPGENQVGLALNSSHGPFVLKLLVEHAEQDRRAVPTLDEQVERELPGLGVSACTRFKQSNDWLLTLDVERGQAYFELTVWRPSPLNTCSNAAQAARDIAAHF